MSDKRIIYTNSEGGVSIIVPSPNWKGTIKELADKDVPINALFKIVDISEIPSDRTFAQESRTLPWGHIPGPP